MAGFRFYFIRQASTGGETPPATPLKNAGGETTPAKIKKDAGGETTPAHFNQRSQNAKILHKTAAEPELHAH